VGTFAHTGTFIEEFVCKKLGLEAAPISTQVLQRDRHAEFMAAIAITGATIEKIATEIRNLQRTDVGELEEPFRKGQKGSSAMPHKRNPVSSEQMSGLARVLRANMMVSFENVALWHERDISHSSAERVIVPDATSLLHYMLHHCNRVISGARPLKRNIEANIMKTRGLIFSQRVLLALVDKGMTREDAYAVVQRNAMKTWEGGLPFADNLLADGDFTAQMTENELEELLNPASYLRYVDEIYERCGLGS